MIKLCRALRAKQGVSLALAAVSMLLAGCGIFAPKEPGSRCPPVAIVGETARLVKFRPGPGRDLTDVEYEAQLSNFQGKCDFDKKGVNIDVVMEFTVMRGPALQSAQAQFDYFVAIPRYRPAEVGKRIFSVGVRFETQAQRGVLTDEVHMQIPIKPEEAEGYEIYLGLQLTPDQVEFNRTHKSR